MRTISQRVAASICLALLSTTTSATLLGYNTCNGANDCVIASDTGTPIPDPIQQDPNSGILLGWDEKQNVTLSEKLYVNRVADPNADFIGSDAQGTFIESGTVVSSHYFQWDPGNESDLTVESQLQFDSDIFAFITSDQNLFDSDDALALAGYDYNDFTLRGLESGDTTEFAPGGDDSLVNIQWSAQSPGDWTRLITAFSPGGQDDDPPSVSVPEPSTVLLLGLALLGMSFRRFVGTR